MKKLLYFSASWCGPCKALSPIIDKVAKEMGISLQKIDVDENADQAANFKIRSIPTVILFEDDTPIDQFVGVQKEQKIRDFIKRD